MEPPYFFQLLARDPLFLSVLRARTISEVVVKGNYALASSSGYSLTIADFELYSDEFFDSVNILITRYGRMIEYLSRDPKYFEESNFYFNIGEPGRMTRNALNRSLGSLPCKRKRIGRFDIFEGELQATVLHSTPIGSKIVIFYKKDKSYNEVSKLRGH